MKKLLYGLAVIMTMVVACKSDVEDLPPPQPERWRISHIIKIDSVSWFEYPDTMHYAMKYNADGVVQEIIASYGGYQALEEECRYRLTYANNKIVLLEEKYPDEAWQAIKRYIYEGERLKLVQNTLYWPEMRFSTDSIVYGGNNKPSEVWQFGDASGKEVYMKLAWQGEQLASWYQADIYGEDTTISEAYAYAYTNKPGMNSQFPDQLLWKLSPMEAKFLAVNNVPYAERWQSGRVVEDITYSYLFEPDGRIKQSLGVREARPPMSPDGSRFYVRYYYEKY